MTVMFQTSLIGFAAFVFAAAPTSTNFTLKAYDFGDGGGTGSSTNYSINGSTNGQSGDSLSSTNYRTAPGLAPTINASVPPAPTFNNPDQSDTRLRLTINTGGNPSDTTYAVAISTNNFVTTQYVQNDTTVGAVLGSEDRLTYAGWGGATGIWVTGLTASTSYSVKVKAYQGKFTETGYGPVSSASTSAPTLTFSVATTASGTPPFNVAFSSLAPGSVFTADADALLTLSTNAANGGAVYVYDQYAGLRTAAASYTLASATADLAGAQRGYGAQVVSASQTSGGPFTAQAPFNGTAQNVGILSTTLQTILSSSAAVTGGSATVSIKAKTDITVPASTDYTDRVTFIASMKF